MEYATVTILQLRSEFAVKDTAEDTMLRRTEMAEPTAGQTFCAIIFRKAWTNHFFESYCIA